MCETGPHESRVNQEPLLPHSVTSSLSIYNLSCETHTHTRDRPMDRPRLTSGAFLATSDLHLHFTCTSVHRRWRSPQRGTPPAAARTHDTQLTGRRRRAARHHSPASSVLHFVLRVCLLYVHPYIIRSIYLYTSSYIPTRPGLFI